VFVIEIEVESRVDIIFSSLFSSFDVSSYTTSYSYSTVQFVMLYRGQL